MTSEDAKPVPRITTVVPLSPIVAIAADVHVPRLPQPAAGTIADTGALGNDVVQAVADMLAATDCSHVQLRDETQVDVTNQARQMLLEANPQAFSRAPLSAKKQKKSVKRISLGKPKAAKTSVVSFQEISLVEVRSRAKPVSLDRLHQLMQDKVGGHSAQASEETISATCNLFTNCFTVLSHIYPPQGAQNNGAAGPADQAHFMHACKVLQSLQASLVAVGGDEIVQRVSKDHLALFCNMCANMASAGLKTVLTSASEPVSSQTVQHCLGSLAAATVLLTLLSAPSCPREMLQELYLQVACTLAAQYTLTNVGAFVNATIRREHHPDPGAIGTSKSLPPTLAALAQSVVALLGSLVTLSHTVAIKNQALTALVRALVEVLNVPTLATMHAAAIDLLLRVHALQRESADEAVVQVVDEVLSGVAKHALTTGHVKPCHLVAEGVTIRPFSLFLLRLIEVSAAGIPASRSAPHELQHFLNIFYSTPSSAWYKLLAQLHCNPDVLPKDVKAFISDTIDDLTTLLPLPAWPAAELLLASLLQCLSKELSHVPVKGTGKGAAADAARRDIRDQVLDISGALIARVLPLCTQSEDAVRLFWHLVGRLEAGDADTPEKARPMPVPLPSLRAHAPLVRLLLQVHVAKDAGEGASRVGRIVRSAAAVSLYDRCHRVFYRDSSTHKPAAHMPMFIGPEVSAPSCLEDCHRALAFTVRDEGAAGLATSARLERSQAGALHTLLLHGGLVHQQIDTALGKLVRLSRVHVEPSKRVRGAAWKALSVIIQAWPEVLSTQTGVDALQSALSPEETSAQVQDAALQLLSNRMRSDAAFCGSMLGLIQRATAHGSTSVRKRAVDIVWDCYINNPVYTKVQENAANVTSLLLFQMKLFDDSEAGLRPKLVDAFRKRWFSASNSNETKAAASDFAAIVGATVGNDSQALPLPHDAVLCRILRAILVADVLNAPTTDVKKLLAEVEPARQNAYLVADALLDTIVGEAGGDADADPASAEDQDPSAGYEPAGAAAAIFALASIDADLLMRTQQPNRRSGLADPFKFVDSLRLYLDAEPTLDRMGSGTVLNHCNSGQLASQQSLRRASSQALPELMGARGAETLLRALLFTVSLLLRRAHERDMTVPAVLLADLGPRADKLIRSPAINRSQPLRYAVCRFIGAVVLISEELANGFFDFCEQLYTSTLNILPRSNGNVNDAARRQKLQQVSMYLSILGPLLHNLASHPSAHVSMSGPLPGAAADDEQQPLTRCVLDLATSPLMQSDVMRPCALEVVTQVILGFPDDFEARRKQVVPILQRAMLASSHSSQLRRLLSFLADLLRSEEHAREHSNAREDDEPAKAEVARRNGMDDGVSNAASIIQALWDIPSSRASARGPAGTEGGIKSALLYVASDANANSALSQKLVIRVRQQAMSLVELIHRGGVLAPWMYLPPTIALATDTAVETSERALALLKLCSYKASERGMIAGALRDGLKEALQFHTRLARATAEASSSQGGERPDVTAAKHWAAVHLRIAGSGGLFATVLAHHKELKERLYSVVLETCVRATNASTSAQDGCSPFELRFLDFVLRLLVTITIPLKDDVLKILHEVSRLISRKAESLRADVAASFSERMDDVACSSAAPMDASAVRQARRACVGMCLILVFRKLLMNAYHVTEAAIDAYTPQSSRVDGVAATRSKKAAWLSSPVNLQASEEPEQMRSVFKQYETLLDAVGDAHHAQQNGAQAPAPSTSRKKSKSCAAADVVDCSGDADTAPSEAPAPKKRRTTNATKADKKPKKKKRRKSRYDPASDDSDDADFDG